MVRHAPSWWHDRWNPSPPEGERHPSRRLCATLGRREREVQVGSTYSNVTVVGAAQEQVLAAMQGSGALVSSTVDAATTVFSPSDEMEGLGQGQLAARLSADLDCAALESMVYDDDVFQLQVFVGGALAASAVGPPSGVEIMAEMMGDMEETEDMAELMGDMGDVPPQQPDETDDHGAAQVVTAVGRGDVDALSEALDNDASPFASDTHRAVFVALGLPTTSVGWGHRYLSAEPDGYDGAALTEA
jgi:hypothetical protein